MTAQELYRTDFFEWTQRNAELLSRGCFDLADIAHIAEELADMGARDQREVKSYLRRLILHLLKWQMQPSKRSPSWQTSIGNSRSALKDIFEQSPSLRRLAVQSVPKIYADTRQRAAAETGLVRSAFPLECPYTFAQLMQIDFYPVD
ncbi:MAG TPA: DUF29 domain-containing protein [Bryobacteraceae bacterium]|jgi:hypothetical protein